MIDCSKHNIPCDWFVWLKIKNKVVCKTVKVRILVASNEYHVLVKRHLTQQFLANGCVNPQFALGQ